MSTPAQAAPKERRKSPWNPVRWVRWKVVGVLVAIFGVLYFLGLNPLARWQINNAGASAKAARWNVSQVGLGLLTGDFEFGDLWVDSSGKRKRQAADGTSGETLAKVFQTALARLDVSTGELLRARFVVDEIRLNAPQMNVKRRVGGDSNLGDLGEEEEDEKKEEKETGSSPTDWVETALKWYERLQKIHDKLGGKKKGEKGESDEEAKERARRKSYYARQVTYPFENRPGVVVRQVVADDLQIHFADENPATGGVLPRLENGSVSITGLSSRPSLHDAPMELQVRGDLVPAAGRPEQGATMKLSLKVDYTKEPSKYSVELDTGMVPAEIVGAFVGRSLPVRLKSGKIGISAAVELDSKETLKVAPSLRFQGVELEAKDPAGRIAGLKAADFVKAFNEASAVLLGEAPLEIADLRITGTVSQPRFEWGDTVTKLVTEGGKAFARKYTRKAEELLDKERGKLEEKIQKKIGAEVDDVLGEGGTKKAVEGGLDLIKGVLGGKKQKEQK